MSTLTGIPALTDLIMGMMILAGTTLRNLIPTRVSNPTLTPAAHADIHRPIGMKFSSTSRNTITTSGIIQPIAATKSIMSTPPFFLSNSPHEHPVPFHSNHTHMRSLRHEGAF